MDEFKAQLMAKAGLDDITAAKVVGFVQDNWDDVVKWIGGEKFGDLKENVAEVMGDAKEKISGLFKK